MTGEGSAPVVGGGGGGGVRQEVTLPHPVNRITEASEDITLPCGQ